MDLVSEVNWLLDAQWVWENWVLLETLHVWNQGQIPNWLFSTICVYYEGQGSAIILCGAEHSEPLPYSLHCQNNWQNKVLIKRVVTYPDPNTQMLCVLGQVIYSFLIWTADTCYMGSLNILLVINIKSLFTFMANHGDFPTDMFIWNTFSTYLLGSERIFMCQMMIIPLL